MACVHTTRLDVLAPAARIPMPGLETCREYLGRSFRPYPKFMIFSIAEIQRGNPDSFIQKINDQQLNLGMMSTEVSTLLLGIETVVWRELPGVLL